MLMRKAAFAAGMLVLAAQGAYADDWTINITVDNQYDIYFGTPTATSAYVGGDNNWFTPETYNVTGRASTDFIYVSTASDRAVAQGFLASFKNTTTNIELLTGGAQWEVFRAGDHLQAIFGMPNGSWGASVQPTQAQVDAAILYASVNSLWTNTAGNAQYNNGFASPWFQFPSISSAAEWVWSPRAGGGNPLQPGGDHGEFLVFRVKGGDVPTPGAAALAAMGGLLAARRRRR
jgi:MYXO-CTERM domain-containing protein